MTREEILKMEAGSELDAIIEKTVMGLELRLRYYKQWTDEEAFELIERGIPVEPVYWDPHPYSTDIATAWQVVDKIKELTFYNEQQHPTREPWITFCRELVGSGCEGDGFNLSFWWVDAERISKAALLAVMEASR